MVLTDIGMPSSKYADFVELGFLSSLFLFQIICSCGRNLIMIFHMMTPSYIRSNFVSAATQGSSTRPILVYISDYFNTHCISVCCMFMEVYILPPVLLVDGPSLSCAAGFFNPQVLSHGPTRKTDSCVRIA